MTGKNLVLKCVFTVSLFFFGSVLWTASVQAQSNTARKSVVDVISAATADPSKEGAPAGEDTHAALRLTPDKSEIIKLDADAKSVIVGNPDHVSILAESARLLVVVPKSVGSTYFTVLDVGGKVVMQRHVIVGSPKDHYVRVKKTCQTSSAGNKTGTCKPTSVYYCPDMCHNIGAEEEMSAAQQSASEDEPEKEEEEDKQKPVYEESSEGETE